MNLPQPSRREEDARVVEGLVQEWSGPLERIAWAILRDWPLAADALQETFALLTQKLAEIPPDHRRGWLIRTVQYQAHNLRRKQQRFHQLPERLLASGWVRSNGNDSAEHRALECADQLQRLRTAVDALPEAQRVIVLGRLRDEKTFVQLASDLQLPLGTVLSRMRLALEKLRKTVDE